MVLKTLRATTPSGTLDARGDIAWQPATGWKLDATLDGFDPGYFAAGWDGDIDGTIATRGRTLDGGGFDATLSVPTLTGTLRGRTLDGKAEFTAQGETYRGTGNLTLDSGHIDIESDASTGPRLHWDARAPPARFAPGFFVSGAAGPGDP